MRPIALPLTLLSLVGAPALAAAPGPEPRLEAALSTYVFSQQERSVELSRTMPPIAYVRKPAVGRAEGVQVSRDVFVERRLMPEGEAAKDREAVRIYPRDAR